MDLPELKTYLRGLGEDAAREDFAAACGTSLGHLKNAAFGNRKLNAAVCAQAEIASGGALKRWHLCPLDWHRIWPELIATEGAPTPEPKAAA